MLSPATIYFTQAQCQGLRDRVHYLAGGLISTYNFCNQHLSLLQWNTGDEVEHKLFSNSTYKLHVRTAVASSWPFSNITFEIDRLNQK